LNLKISEFGTDLEDEFGRLIEGEKTGVHHHTSLLFSSGSPSYTLGDSPALQYMATAAE
jgi:hypothetical protein